MLISKRFWGFRLGNTHPFFALGIVADTGLVVNACAV